MYRKINVNFCIKLIFHKDFLYIYHIIIHTVVMTFVDFILIARKMLRLIVAFKSISRRVKAVIDAYGGSTHVELQQRSVEYSNIFTKYENMR